MDINFKIEFSQRAEETIKDLFVILTDLGNLILLAEKQKTKTEPEKKIAGDAIGTVPAPVKEAAGVNVPKKDDAPQKTNKTAKQDYTQKEIAEAARPLLKTNMAGLRAALKDAQAASISELFAAHPENVPGFIAKLRELGGEI